MALIGWQAGGGGPHRPPGFSRQDPLLAVRGVRGRDVLQRARAASSRIAMLRAMSIAVGRAMVADHIACDDRDGS